MNETAEVILQGFDSRTPVSVRHAVFVSVSGGSALVEMAGSRFSAEFGAGFIPRAGETVQILSLGERHLMFPARPLPGVGTVQTVSSGIVTVQTVIGTFAMPYVGTAPTSGDLVGVSWSEQPYVLGKLSVQPNQPEPVPDPGAGQVRSATFRAIDTGSTSDDQVRWWQEQPTARASGLGAWFYGTQIRDTIPAGASLVKLEFYVDWRKRSGADPNFGLHALTGKNALPTFTAVQAWAPGDGWQTPPNAQAWFDGLKAGGGRLGVGLNHGGNSAFASRAQNSMTGALRISWRT